MDEDNDSIALEAAGERAELASHRATFPKLCAEYKRRTVLQECKAMTHFEIERSIFHQEKVISDYSNSIPLDATNNPVISFDVSRDFSNQILSLQKALLIINKNKH